MAIGARVRRGLQVFDREHAPTLEESGAMTPRVANQAALDAFPRMGGAAEGNVVKLLFGDPDTPDGGGLSLVRVRFASNFQLPRHSHDTDCLYYVVSGELQMGGRTVVAGEGFFVPADAPYAYTAGPEGVEVLEFRPTSRFDIKLRESAAGWERIIASTEANRAHWAGELAHER